MAGLPRSLERLASPEVRSRGESYFFRKTVRLLQADAESIVAEVQGTQIYKVRVRKLAGIAYYSCACPFYAREFTLCKHVWAVLATVASRRGLEDWPARAEEWTASSGLEPGELAGEGAPSVAPAGIDAPNDAGNDAPWQRRAIQE